MSSVTGTGVTLLAAVAVATCVAAIADLFFSLRRQDRKRIARRLSDDLGTAERQRKEKQNALIRDLTREQNWALARWLTGTAKGMSFRKLCLQAALPWPAHVVLAGLALSMVVVLGVALVLRVHPATATGLMLLVGMTPLGVIVTKRNKRLQKFNLQLPEVFELLSQSLRAGHALPAGVQLVADQLADPAGVEFSRVQAEQDLGVRLEDALENLAERVDILDVRMFVTAIHIQRQTGGDLTEVMDKLGAVIRDRIKMLNQVRALTAEGRLSGWILAALPVVLLFIINLLNPEYMSALWSGAEGRIVMAVAVCMQVLGMLIIRKIVNIKI